LYLWILNVYLSKTNIKSLRQKVEQENGFQIALVPMQSNIFLNVHIAIEALYKKLSEAGYSVLVDDRDQKPSNKFKVIEFLNIQHRVVISGRSISAGVYEYKDLLTDYFEKVPEKEIYAFLNNRIY